MRAKKSAEAKVFWTGRSQAVRLPKEFRFDCETVSVHREGNTLVLSPRDAWPDDYVASFAGVPDDFERPSQGEHEERSALP
ncbi:MAG: AbrB/MazE/SpoVT family DNA-binding domain-containing protein [Deltaproteobacteria bacterium]|nr:AbrB/MazE/SpoVT family DNA-binding domain-containing protein [Deltaproteobacteria bacterium]